MTPLAPSIWSIVSAGTSRRRREKRPDFTESASGTSGAVPYIGHSTLPTRRPCLSATMYPAVRRRSMAIALMRLTLFSPCKDSCGVGVKGLLTRHGFLLRVERRKDFPPQRPRAAKSDSRSAVSWARPRRGRAITHCLTTGGKKKPSNASRTASGPDSEDRQVLLHLPVRELHAVLVPLLSLQLDVAVEDVGAEGFARNLGLRQLVDRLAERLGEAINELSQS